MFKAGCTPDNYAINWPFIIVVTKGKKACAWTDFIIIASIQLYKEEMPYYKMWLALVAEQIVGSLTPNSLGWYLRNLHLLSLLNPA